ncbi:hypothetical protein Y032_0001g313 [Ancylostoma ceylanicum]|uniref:Uncharacterized protein n=1 Tax=Ancylostoma ceylanicum TaxID=53326 RepID=A0A016W2Z9_9BILA|nr:hypothetical protein Y032_0001g313 [Ancylostoma ceylanicum]
MSGLSVSGCPFSRYLGVFPYPLSAPLSGHLAPDIGADKAKWSDPTGRDIRWKGIVWRTLCGSILCADLSF